MPMPMTLKRLPPSLAASADNSGISETQGPHQDAQKFTSSGLPFHWPSDCGLPARSFSDDAYRLVTAVCGWPPVGLYVVVTGPFASCLTPAMAPSTVKA